MSPRPSPLASGLAPQIKLGAKVTLPKATSLKTQQGRKTLLIKTVDAVHAGHIDEAAGAKVLRAAGFPDSKNPFSNAHAPGIKGVAASVATHLGLNVPATRRAGRADVAAYGVTHPGAATIPITDAPRLGGIIGVGPNLGLGLIGQTAFTVGQGLTNAPAGGAEFITHPVRTAEKAYEHVRHPDLADAAFLGYVGAVGAATGVVRGVAAGKALASGAGKRAAITRSGEEGGSLLHTPAGKPVRIYVPHAPEEGQVGPVNASVFERPVSRNVLARPVQRARGKIIQRQVNRDARAGGLPVVGGRLPSTFSARTTVARENRAARRTNLALANADAVALDRAVSKLSPAEQNAIGVAAIAGEEALTNPALAVARQQEAHRHFAALGTGDDAAANLQRVQDLGTAQQVLENPSAKFLKALELTRQTSRKTEAQLIDAGHLTPEIAKGRMNNLADVYGYPEAPSGSFFISQHPSYVQSGARLPAFSGRPSPSLKGTPPPAITGRVRGLGQKFGGESIGKGYVAGPEVVARRAILVNKALDAKQHYEDLWQVGSPTKSSVYDVPYRDSRQIREEVRSFFDRLSDLAHESEDAAAVLGPQEVAKVAELLKPDVRSFGNVPVGGSVDGIRWVDRRLDVDLTRAIGGDEVTTVVDAVNNFARLNQLYLRPAYILNLPGNLIMNTISEGLRVPGAAKNAVRGNVIYGDDVMRWIDAGTGASLSRTYSIGTGPLGKLSNTVAEVWNGITDMHARRIAFFAEAGRQGIRTPAQMQALKAAAPNSPLGRKRTMIFRVANKNIVDYGSLTPFEANTARRWIYFYPWVSRGTIWALRTLVENPGKTFTLFELGRVGAESVHKALGEHEPRWAGQQSFVPVPGGKGDIQNVSNLSSIWTYPTAVQAGAAISDTLKSLAGKPQAGALGEAATPASDLLLQAMTRSEGGPQKTGIPGYIESLPIAGILRRSGVVDAPSNTYPETGIVPGVGPFLGGGPVPRGISKAALGEGAVKQARTPKAKLLIEVDQLVERGLLTPERAEQMKAIIPGEDDAAVRADRRQAGELLKSVRPAKPSTISKLRGLINDGVQAGLITPQDADAKKRDASAQTEAVLSEYMSDLKAALHR